ncbi:dephospho-CoA kinase [Rhodococcus sp. D2-41]|nr:dephospho-CoA kinase [Rhodococcus sp. D2-41]
MGLTGGIGAGKSTVSKALAAKGAVIVDADLIAREVVEPGTPGLAALVEAFGEDILAADGTLDRPGLAAKAFASDEARGRLNAILHPLIGARTAELVEGAGPDAVVVQDIPLLVEGGLAPAFHIVVIVHADVEERIRRLVNFRGIPEADARARVAAQANDDQRRLAADVWLDNTGDPADLAAAVDELWEERLRPYQRNLLTGTPARCSQILVESDPDWARQGERLAARLRAACGDRAVRVDHIGPTAVPGLAARDVIDLQVCVPSMAVADELADVLAAAGFPRQHDRADGDLIDEDLADCLADDPSDGDLRLHGAADPDRPAMIHVRESGSAGEHCALILRDWLRADAATRADYAGSVHSGSTQRQWLQAHREGALAWADAAGWTITAS